VRPLPSGSLPAAAFEAAPRSLAVGASASRFLGIVISLYYNDHPPPHFHVRYGDLKAIIDIESLTILYGELTPRVLGLVVEWAALELSF
jgi:hypothetical protein